MERAFPPLALSQIWKLPLWLVLIHTDYSWRIRWGEHRPVRSASSLSVRCALGTAATCVVAAWAARVHHAAAAVPYGGSADLALHGPGVLLLAGWASRFLITWRHCESCSILHGRTCRVY